MLTPIFDLRIWQKDLDQLKIREPTNTKIGFTNYSGLGQGPLVLSFFLFYR